MDRRWWGTVMVVLVFLAALIVPNLTGRRTNGTASRVPVPDPPQVGQCLLGSIDLQRSALTYSQVAVTAAPVGQCADANYGEVVSVTADHHDFPSTVVNRVRHPEPLACQSQARGYLGWDASSASVTGEATVSDPPRGAGGDPMKALGPWRPVSTVYVGLLGPNIWQYLSGQTWIACVVYPRAGPYAGTVRDGVAGSAAAAFGLCADGPEPALQQRVSCAEPHSTEAFAATGTGEASQDVLTASCRALVAAATGMTDPTAGRELSVAVEGGGSFGLSVPPAIPGASSLVYSDPRDVEPGQVSCVVGVVGDRQLVGSLTGLGGGPLPWAP